MISYGEADELLSGLDGLDYKPGEAGFKQLLRALAESASDLKHGKEIIDDWLYEQTVWPKPSYFRSQKYLEPSSEGNDPRREWIAPPGKPERGAK